MKDRICGNCKFFDLIDKGEGSCRKHPPVFVNGYNHGAWPVVPDYEWCADFDKQFQVWQPSEGENGTE